MSEPQLIQSTSAFFSGLGGSHAARISNAAIAHARPVNNVGAAGAPPAAAGASAGGGREPTRRGRFGEDDSEQQKQQQRGGKQQQRRNKSPSAAHSAETRFGAESSGKQLQYDVQWLELGLCKALTRATAHLGFLHPTPVQTAAIPLILSGHDVVARAVTGSGKSAALLLPLVHRLVTSGRAVGGFGGSQHGRFGGPNAPVNTASARRGNMNGVVRSLILEPSRELGTQLHDFAASLSHFVDRLKTVLVIGGVAAQAQEAQLAEGADIVVATPGRIIDLLYNYSNFDQARHTPFSSKSSAVVAGSTTNRGRKFDLSGVELVALDECDELLTSETLRPQIEDIFSKFLPPLNRRQTVLLSATLTKRVDDFVSNFMSEDDVRIVDIGKVALAAQLRQHFIRCGDLTTPRAAAAASSAARVSAAGDADNNDDDPADKAAQDNVVHSSKRKTPFLVAACQLFYGGQNSSSSSAATAKNDDDNDNDGAAAAAAAAPASTKRVLIFAKHRSTVHRLCIIFQLLGLPATELRGDLDVSVRAQALADFVSGESNFLFTTDIASRGLDLPAVDTVINFDLPPTLSSYIHRVGRTARIGKKGVAVSLVDDAEDGDLMRKIVALSRTSDNAHQSSTVKRRDLPEAAVAAARDEVDAVFPLVKNVLAGEVVQKQLALAERKMKHLDVLTERQQNLRAALTTQSQEQMLAEMEGRRRGGTAARIGSVAQAVLPAPRKKWALSSSERHKREEAAKQHYTDEVESKLTALQAHADEANSGLQRADKAQVDQRRRARDKKEAARDREKQAQKQIRQKAQQKLKAGAVKKMKQKKLRDARREERSAKREADGGRTGKKGARRSGQKAKAGSKKFKRHKRK